MKKIFALSVMLLSLSSVAQLKNNLYYTADIIHSEILKNFETDSQEVIIKNPLGIDVEIRIDTIFRKYYLTFTDENQQRRSMSLSYFMDRDKGLSELPSTINKRYIMEMDGREYYLTDYIQLFRSLQIADKVPQKQGYIISFKINGIRKKE